MQDPARAFLSLLTSNDNSPLTWQLLDDKKNGLPARILHGSFADLAPTLKAFNNMGYGIFLMINAGDGQSRTNASTTRVRALFADLDGAPIENITRLPVAPSFIIATSPNRFHVYYLTNCELPEFSQLQKNLAAQLDSDPSINDLARVMRVPGFLHQKGDPFLVGFFKDAIPAARLTHDVAVFRALPPPANNSTTFVDATVAPTINRNAEYTRIAGALRRKGAAEPDILTELLTLNGKSANPLDQKELERIARNISKKPINDSDDKLKKIVREKLKPATAERGEKKGRKKKEPLCYEEYLEFFQIFLGDLRRDIFSGQLMCLNKSENLWLPAINHVDYLTSRFLTYCEKNPERSFCRGDIIPHLDRLEHESPRRLVIDIPEWDNIDRIQMLADRLAVDATHGLTELNCVELLKDWHSKLWAKLDFPETQNRLIVLTGPQEIGKDFWINENIGGLGQFANPLHVEQNNKDTRLQLHASMVCTIAEFDRTSKWEQSTLKDLVTASATNMRAPYERAARFRHVRCSLVSSCNISDVLIDPTGNRRYILFHLTNIDRARAFTHNDKMQVLAQGKALAAQNYRATTETEAALKLLLKAETPQGFKESILEQFDLLAYADFELEGSFYNEEFHKTDKTEKNEYAAGIANGSSRQARIFQELRRANSNLPEFKLRKLLSQRRRSVRTSGGVRKIYLFRNPEAGALH